MPQNPSLTFNARKIDPVFNDEGHTYSVLLQPNSTFIGGTVLGQIAPANAASAVQTLTMTGAPTGGTFTLTYNGQTTAAIPYNATSAQVQAALSALTNIGAGQVVCAGGQLPGTPITVTFAGLMANLPIALMTASSAGLTGGASPTLTPTTTTAGVAGGRFKAYASGNSDGSQNPKCILAYDCVTDDRGYVTIGNGVTSPEYGAYENTLAYYRGVFKIADVIGADANMLLGANSIGSLIYGASASDQTAIFTLN